ncbi:MAG TPA: M23 family metallopeptidase [Gemmatimonadaceae bacterium]|nr:M23 family metallopeptidase [Gemmatimonadaceae bacterium]
MHRAAAASSARHLMSFVIACALLSSTACEVISNKSGKQDTTTLVTTPTTAPSLDTTAPGGVPAAPPDSLATSAARDTGVVTLYPNQPVRGGVLFALAEGVASDIPRCSWKGTQLPCARVSKGVLAIIPLPADEAAGTFTLSFERPAGRISRQVTVSDHDFGRELVFLDSAHYALVKRTSDVARDARALRGVLATESDVRRWSGKWGAPVQGSRSAGYGVERFYYRAADSSRAISLGPDMKTRGTFGLDTSGAAANVPSWRHAGVDIAAARKTSVNAPAAGIVADVGEYILTGRTVIIDHGQGVMTAYFHLDTVLVRRGDQVSAGKRIGRVGATGLATGPHLHYGVYIHGKDVDPAAWSAMPSFVRDDTRPKSAAP